MSLVLHHWKTWEPFAKKRSNWLAWDDSFEQERLWLRSDLQRWLEEDDLSHECCDKKFGHVTTLRPGAPCQILARASLASSSSCPTSLFLPSSCHLHCPFIFVMRCLQTSIDFWYIKVSSKVTWENPEVPWERYLYFKTKLSNPIHPVSQQTQ